MKSRINYRYFLVGSCAICGLLSGVPAQAQVAQQVQQAPDRSETMPVLQEVVVTAQRRSERLVSTPISIFAISGQGLQQLGITNAQQLQEIVPGLHMDATGPSSQPTIRGVGSAISGPGDSSNVATYVDGFYRPSMSSSNFIKFSDVNSVQVLKGPQGTLFGRNATGGAILITTENPSFTPEAQGRLSYSSYNTVDGSLFVAGPISIDLAASLSAYVSNSDGYFKNIVDGKNYAPEHDWGLRTKLLYKPTDKLNFTLTYEHTRINDPAFAAYNAYNGWSDGALIPGTIVTSAQDKVSLDAASPVKVSNDALLLKSVANFDWATLTSYTGLIHEDVFNQTDLDASSAPIETAKWNIHEDTITQEFDLTSSRPGNLQWVSGLYYYYDNEAYTNFQVSVFGSPFFVAFQTAQQKSMSGAVFIDGTYNIAQNWYLTVGARYSYDHLGDHFILGTTTPGNAQHDFQNAKPRVVLRYQFAPASDVYFSFSQGYKSGVYNVFGASTTPVQPEEITAYELGYKTATPRWRFEGAIFYYDYSNLQINTYVAASSVLLNAASSEIYGADANFSAKLSDRFTLNLSGAYTHGRYVRFPNDPSYTWNPAAGGVVIGTVNGANYTMQRTPTFQGNVGLTYSQPLADGKLELVGDFSYQSKVYFDPADVTSQSGYGLLNLRAAWTDPSSKWTFSVYGNNVTDQKYIFQVLPGSFAFSQVSGAPVTVGAEVRFKY